MTFNLLQMLAYALAIVLFAAWFVVANGLGRDTTEPGRPADTSRRQRMRWLMIAGFAVLISAMGAPYLIKR